MTARFQDRVYIEDSIVPAGLAVATTTALNLGDEIRAQGTMGTANGERALNATAITVIAAANYLLAPGFESGFTGGVGANWTAFLYSGSVSRADSATTVHSGSHSQKVICATGADEGGVYQQFDTVVNQNYTISLWVNCGSAPDSQPGGYLDP